MQITVTIDDGSLDAFAELIVNKLLSNAPGLIDAPFERGSTPALVAIADASPAPAASFAPAVDTLAPGLAAFAPADASAHSAGYAGAVVDPQTGMHVLPGDLTMGADSPAIPAPPPADAPA